MVDGNAVIDQLIRWASERNDVRAILMTSSRANPDAPLDMLSDYDVILAVTDIRPYFDDRAWLGDFGPVLVVYRDPVRLEYGLEKFIYVTQYENGLKIDFTLWPVEILRRLAETPELPPDIDLGYIVLLDKDRLTEGMKLPSHKAYIPAPPGEAAYLELVEIFFHEATYVAKYLWRDDLIAAKYNLDQMMKFKFLRQMLEWLVEIDHEWSVKMGAYGRGLKEHVRPEIWSRLERTYVGADLEENWEALFETIALFSKVATEVGEHLGYAYPNDLERRMLIYLQKVRRLDPDAESFG
jgi:aminoglycoside 6-adenylyltransferase